MGVAVALSLTGLAACGGGSGSSNTVSFFSWDPQKTMQPLIDEFQKENPGIKVQFSWAPPVPQYISTLQTRLRSGTAADVFIITAENKVQIMDGKLAKDLSKEPFIGNLAPAAKATYTKDGAIYGAATASWGGGILYNKDLLAKVGFSQPPQTWADFLALCAKLKGAGITPFLEATDGIPVTVAALVGLQNQQLGGDMDAQIWAGKTTFANTWTQPLTLWSQLFGQGLETRSAAGLTGDQVMQEFEKGTVAMTSTGSWAIGSIRTAAPKLNLGFMAVPGQSGTYWAGAVSPGYAINAKTKHLSAAEKFVTFLQSKSAVETYQKETGSITTTVDYTPTLDPALSDMVTAVRAGTFYLPQTSWVNNSDALNTEAIALLQQLAQGKLSPQQAASGLDTKLKSLNG
jgi:raffinose/stachyose/melibiose transport system substrate-binding protein